MRSFSRRIGSQSPSGMCWGTGSSPLFADRIASEESPNTFATALIALIDIRKNRLLCLSAGHPGPLLWTGDDKVLDVFFTDGLLEWERDVESAELALRRVMMEERIRLDEPAHRIRDAVIGTAPADDVAILTVRKR